MNDLPNVSVILINLNQEHHTRECLRSLRSCSYRSREIVLVDNGSTDGSGFRLRDEFPEVLFIRNEQNLGFAEGNNVGIRFALARGAQYILLLNNDTVVEPHFIEPLVARAQNDSSIAAQSGKILYDVPNDVFWYAGGVLQRNRALVIHRGMGEKERGQYDDDDETDFATGCLMFMTRQALTRIGELDDTYFAYYEDVDWCLRAQDVGYRIVYNAQSKIWHKVSSTSSHDSPLYLYLTMRNKLLFLRRHNGLLEIITSLPYFFLFYVRQVVRMIFKWKSWRGAQAVLKGILDGIQNRGGTQGVERWFTQREEKKR
jgi:GT2 family glycosyltransferase